LRQKKRKNLPGQKGGKKKRKGEVEENWEVVRNLERQRRQSYGNEGERGENPFPRTKKKRQDLKEKKKISRSRRGNKKNDMTRGHASVSKKRREKDNQKKRGT